MSYETIYSPLSTDRAYPLFGRSLYDVDLSRLVDALTVGDETAPFLAANALRLELARTRDVSWRATCDEFAARAVAEAAQQPNKYAERIVDLTRNTPRYDESRRLANGMVGYQGFADDRYRLAVESAGYGLLWAYEKEMYHGQPAISRYVVSIVARNEQRVGLPAGMYGETVYPGYIPNSYIDAALLYYDMQPYGTAGRVMARRAWWLREADQDGWGVYERIDIRDGLADTTTDRQISPNKYERVSSLDVWLEGGGRHPVAGRATG